MSSILLIGAANAETHVATKGYSDTHVAGDPAATANNVDGQVLTWDGTAQKWINKNAASLGGSATIDISEGVVSGKYSGVAPISIDTDGKVSVAYDAETINKNDSNKLYAVEMAGATSENDGKPGIVPASEAGDQDKVLTAGGQWVEDKNTEYTDGNATTVTDDNTIDVNVDNTTIKVDRTNKRLYAPVATTDAVGVVKVGNNLSIDDNGKLDATDTKYSAGDRVTLDTTSNEFSADLATATTAGAVLPDGSTINLNASDGKISVPTASTTELGVARADEVTTTVNASGQIGLKIQTPCPRDTRCALTTATDGSLVWEPLTTPWGDDGTTDSGL